MGHIFVVSGPSGVGKDTACDALREQGLLRKMITITTRPPRPGERHGVHYYFLTPEQFEEADNAGLIGEKTQYIGNGTVYGIYWRDMEDAIVADQPTFVILDAVGLRRMRSLYPGRVTGVYMVARPEVLAERMRKRGDAPESIARRLQNYEQEIASAAEYDHVLDVSDLTPEEQANALKRIVQSVMMASTVKA